jgi:hypothetical protein
VVTAAFAARDSIQSASDRQSRKENGAINPRHFFLQNSNEKGFFYSVNVEVTGLRGFSRRSG